MATLLNARDSVNSVGYSHDAATLVSGHADSTILLSNLRRLREQQQLAASGDGVPADQPPPVRTLVGHSGPVYGLSFSRDDRFLLSSSQDGTARLWSVVDSPKLAGGSCLVCYRGHGFPVWDAAFSPLGYYFATASYDTTARVWATDKLSPLRILVGHLADVHCVRFHPNSNYVLTGSSDCSLRMWDVSSGSCVRLLCGHTAAVTSLAFSPDGRLAASGSADKTVRVWELGSGKELYSFSGHAGSVWSVAFSHDEAGSGLLASGGADSAVRLWDVNTSALSGEGMDSRPAGCVSEFFTRNTPVLYTTFTRRNLLLAAGPYTGR
ncbi:WD40-repeat-containing domain protein [Pavlovales sp. CCMP2436]|nr:WD40-repeat-containing domain protein [Pavlovales sp. CCMP2436]|mmetsp:Transcript_42311/g.104865  ORF Transcript_42311/g.104865 Transcript_42311/m.104865 type:complete len:323 (+) Transcript_42311:258-1226(+)